MNEVADANRVSNQMKHLVHPHHHADHAVGWSLFSNNVVHVGIEETRRSLLRDSDPNGRRGTKRSLMAALWRSAVNHGQLEWHGANYTPDNEMT